jgi:hypothetical protein
MYDHELSIAKRISDTHPHNRRAVAADAGVSREDFEAEISKRSESIRRPGESQAQAFTRYAVETEEGKALMKAALSAPRGRPPIQAAQDWRPEPIGPASKELEELARDMARKKNVTYERAFSAL